MKLLLCLMRLLKNYKTELDFIQKIENLKSQRATISSLGIEVSITKSQQKFQLYFNGIFPYLEGKEIPIKIDDIAYKIGSSDFENRTENPFFDISCEHYFDIDIFKKGKIEKESFFRMFFFDDSNRTNLFHSKLESPKHDGETAWAFNCVRITIKNKRYDIVQHKKEENSYIVIENLDAVTYIDFMDDSYAIQKGIGFLIGYMPGGENYIFAGEDFEYYRLARPSLKSFYYPVTSNPYSFTALHRKNSPAEHYEKILKVIPESVISDLVSRIRENEQFSAALIFMMEVLNLKSAVSMPGVFSVILESLADIIINPENIREKLIADKEVEKSIVSDLLFVIEKYASEINDNALVKIKRRINAINQPINSKRITNAVKLREPFDQLKISLSPRDQEIIDYRNYLLHGNILMHDGTARSSKGIDDHMIYVSAKLYTLISKLILKNSGYEGYIINHARFYDTEEKTNTEDYFEKI